LLTPVSLASALLFILIHGGNMKTLVSIIMVLASGVAMAGIEDCIKTVRAEWPYPAVAEAAKQCQGGVSSSCITYVKSEWPYPAVAEAARICQGNVTESCIKYIRGEWPYPSVTEAAKMCKSNLCEQQ
jgi:hypothetical protein